MQTNSRSATAYDKLAKLTDQYTDGQALLQQWRVLTRAIKALQASYVMDELNVQPVPYELAAMTTVAHAERNRLYQEALRLTNEMTTLNSLIQNGTFNESEAE